MPNDGKEIERKIESVLKGAKKPEAAGHGLGMLFPKSGSSARAYAGGNMELGERRRKHRISERDFSSAYFELDPEPFAWRKSEIEDLLRAEDPMVSFEVVEQRLKKSDPGDKPRLRRSLLEAFDGWFGDSRPLTSQWLRALLDYSPFYIRDSEGVRRTFFQISNADLIRSFLVRTFENVAIESRADLVGTVIPTLKDISLMCDFFRSVLGDYHEEGARGRNPNYFGSRTDELRRQLVDRVRRLAASNQIWAQAEPQSLLWYWWGCGYESEVREFTMNAMETKEGIHALLTIPINVILSTQGDYEAVRRESWGKIMDIELLINRAQSLIRSDSAEDLNRVDRFRAALARGDEDPI